MSPKLRPLVLPQLVEERRRRESLLDSEMDFSTYSNSQNSSASELPSPVTPTFSARHLRYTSSVSSIESSFHSPVNDSPSSPALIPPKAGKRSLPDVQEEPHEREEDLDMLEEPNDLYDCLFYDSQCPHRDSTVAHSSMQLSREQGFEYDFADGFFSDGEFLASPRLKKRKQESPLTGLANRIGTRFPSFSRKWRLRKGMSAGMITSDAQQEYAASRGASSRSSSISNSIRQALDRPFEPQMPLTPTRSIYDSREDVTSTTPINIERANGESREHEEGFATTPLLPPLMIDAAANTKQVSMQSPLQSPSVAESTDPFSNNVTPIDAVMTPQLPGMPSPPLSTKPSISSFHRSNRPAHLIPSSEIPPILIAGPDDAWANKLGHANFTIYPEPYVPESFDLEACRQLRTDWDLARCNYTKHLVRTGEHYGVTSKTYKLTEEKWSSIDSTWRKNNDLTIANTVDSSSEAFATLKYTTLGEPGSANLMTKIPSLNDPRSEGKFPQLGDEDIVGPMVQVAAQLQRSPSKKARFFKFFAEKFPVGLGKLHEH